MSDKIVNTGIVKDQALGLLLKQLMDKHEDNFEAVAAELNETVIKPASERSAAYILRNHHRALFEALPVGDVDAFDILKVVNEHLDKVSQAINMLDAQGGTQVSEIADNMQPEESA